MPKLPSIFGDHMVLQRSTQAPVWGTGEPGEQITVAMGEHRATARADAGGAWRATLRTPQAGGPFDLTVAGDKSGTIRFSDVLVGEVWFGSGQSNMEWPVNLSVNAALEVASANFPQIRLFTVSKTPSAEPRYDPAGSWSACTPQTIPNFSAVAYFFGRELHRSLRVPIGLIHTSWGGTAAEAWTSREAMRAVPALKSLVLDAEKLSARCVDVKYDHAAAMAEWEKEAFHQDPGNKGEPQGWAKPGLNIADWKPMRLPTYWQSLGIDINGAVWFRREVQVPPHWAEEDLLLNLGGIDDLDTTYFNGERVGATGKETPEYWSAPRSYTIPGRLVKAGTNLIAVRVFDHLNVGGFGGPGESMKLLPAKGGAHEAIPLAGEWLYKIELALERRTNATVPPSPQQPINPAHEGYPGALFYGMIYPLIPFAIRGAIWYQGESNAGRAEQYRTLFQTMITDWRARWGQGDFPFLFVQLANWMPAQKEPGESPWAELREAQAMALALPNTGMATAIDIGDAVDIHPQNKQDVGKRLALAAQAIAYGRDCTHCGPTYRGLKIEGDKVRVSFDHAAGLVARGGTPKGFAIAGDDGKFAWADAQIEGDSVVLSSPRVPRPAVVRYAWADNPADINLCNSEGLPALPFRSDVLRSQS